MDTASANGSAYSHPYPLHHPQHLHNNSSGDNINNINKNTSATDSLAMDHPYDYPQRNHANGFYNDLLQEDSQSDGLVYATPAITQQHLKAGLSKVSEGTQTIDPGHHGSPTLSASVQQHPHPHSHSPTPSSSSHSSSFAALPTWPSGTVARFQSSPEPKHSQEHARRMMHSPSNQHSNPALASAGAAAAAVSASTTAAKIPMTPPRISSLTPKSHASHMKSLHQEPHSPPPSPPQPASIDSSFVPRFSPRFPPPQQQQRFTGHGHGLSHSHSNSNLSNSNGHSNSHSNGVDAHDLQEQQHQVESKPYFALEPSPTLSNTESFPTSLASKSTSNSSPASSISVPVGATVQPSPVDQALAALSASSPRPSTSTTSSSASTPTNRPRPSSYAPTKVTDVSSTLANMTTLATLPIPPAPVGAGPMLVLDPSNSHSQEYQQPIASAVPEPSSPTLPSMSLLPAETPMGVMGAGGGYQNSKSNSTASFNPPTRASTMDYRRVHSGSILLGDSPASSSASKQQQQSQLDPQAESSSRSRRNKVYRRNTYSAELASTSFHRSDDEMEMDELDEARRRMDALKKSSSRRMSKRKKDDDTDRVMIGTRIGEDHVNYVLMYNMLTGIRVSVSRCQAKPQRALVDEDFTSAHKLAFDITGNELTPSSKYDFKFKDYAPWVFRHLREDFHIDASDYLVSLTSKYILSELGSPGKSGSFFYFSQDYRFIIKTIHHAEHKFMRKILKDYFNHVKQNPHTLLCRFFGLHRVKLPHGKKIHFVVMGNVFPPNRDIHETYDLKGSTLGRAISDEELNNNPRATQKDLNWVNRNRKLELGPEKRHLFVEQTKRDVELLARLNIMDYSLLIGIHDIERGNKDNIRDNTLKVFHPDTTKQLVREPSRRDKRESKVNALRMAVKVSDPVALGPSTLPSDSFSERRHCIFYADDGGLLSTNEQNERGEDLYYLGIIDILTPYNYVKKIEHYWKSMSQDKHAISAVNPKEYAQRFLSFMIHALKVNNDVLPVLEQSSHPHSE
ncbi:Phosphatidylinositol-4-phosphate 5-kinase [Mortierella alpina]|nr:Phosphatidylinositol-4-phosphate 5-kinase [Mortierella alpina]